MGTMDAFPIQEISGASSTPGSGVLSFDDIVVAPTQATSETEEENGNKEEKSQKENLQEVSADAADGAEGSEQDPQEKTISEASPAEVKKLEKLLKVKAGDKELDLPTSATLKHKVDGKEVDVDVQTLLNNFSGKVSWEKKFTELDKDRKTFEKERESVEGAVDRFYSLAKSGDYQAAVNYLLDLNGIDQRTWWKGFKDQITPAMLDYAKLSDEERAQKEQEEEVTYYRKQHEQSLAERAKAQKIEQLHSQVQQAMQKNGIPQEEFVTAFEELKGIVRADRGNPEQIQPEHVVQFIQSKKDIELSQSLEGVVKEVNPDLAPETLKEKADELKRIFKAYPGMEVAELKDIALQAWGSKAKQNLSRKIAKAAPKATPPQKSYNARSDLIDWDSIT